MDFVLIYRVSFFKCNPYIFLLVTGRGRISARPLLWGWERNVCMISQWITSGVLREQTTNEQVSGLVSVSC